MIPVVTIDGPSGSGKGTISKALAIHLGWNYLDSGLIYRCFAYLTMIGTSDIPKAIKEIEHNFDLNKEEILFNGEIYNYKDLQNNNNLQYLKYLKYKFLKIYLTQNI